MRSERLEARLDTLRAAARETSDDERAAALEASLANVRADAAQARASTREQDLAAERLERRVAELAARIAERERSLAEARSCAAACDISRLAEPDAARKSVVPARRAPADTDNTEGAVDVGKRDDGPERARLKERERAASSAARDAELRRLAGLYAEAIRRRIQGNWRPPLGSDAVDCVVGVTQSVAGEVIDVRVESCADGVALVPALENAITRAVLASSPLPRAPDPELFDRRLRLRFRPS